MVSIYSFGKPLSLPDIDEDTDGEDVGIYLEAACNKCHKYAKSIEAMTEQVDNLQSLLSHREHHLKVIKVRAKRANFTSKKQIKFPIFYSIYKMQRTLWDRKPNTKIWH